MTELKHADVICHMAKHGFESVEYKIGSGDSVNYWYTPIVSGINPITHAEFVWRIKPATITYTVTVPEPLRVMPEDGDDYWCISSTGAYGETWRGGAIEGLSFSLGNIWDTEAKAQQAFDALFGPLKGKA